MNQSTIISNSSLFASDKQEDGGTRTAKNSNKKTIEDDPGSLLSSSDAENEKEKEESGELSSSSSSSSSPKLKKRKVNNDAEEGEIDSDNESANTKPLLSLNNAKPVEKRRLSKENESKRTTSQQDSASRDLPSKDGILEKIDSKLQQIRKLIDKSKLEHETSQHKLEKIERAYIKAHKENNKQNMKKCVKYKQKYEIKVEKLKNYIKTLQSKRVKLQQMLKQKQQTRTKSPIKQSVKLNENNKPINKPSKPSTTQLNSNKNETVKRLKRKIDSDKEILAEKDREDEEFQAKRQRANLKQKIKTKSQLDSNNKNTSPAGLVTPSSSTSKTLKPVSSTSSFGEAAKAISLVIKLPYPVLNDKRDMKTILGTLETKRNELFKKKEQNKKNLDLISSSTSLSASDRQQRIDKIKQLEQAYESQRDKIEKQLEYVQLSLNLETLRNRTNNDPVFIYNNKLAIDQMAAKLNELYLFMKVENKSYLKKQQNLNDSIKLGKSQDQSLQQQSPLNKTGSSLNISTMSPSQSSSTNYNYQVSPSKQATQQQPVQKPIDKLNSLYDVVNNSLAALLAHTAAAAHFSAAISVTNYYYASYYQQQQQPQSKYGNEESIVPSKPLLPLKDELVKASSTFALYRNKISNFLTASKQVEVKSTQASGLKQLISNYGDDDGEASDKEDKKVPVVSVEIETLSSKKEVKEDLEEEENEDDDDEDDSDLEIITTSEIKSQQVKRNYLLPSLKASYFPLKASMQKVNLKTNRPPNTLIAVEKSKNALTFLGMPSAASGRIGLQSRLKLNDILFK